MNGNLHGFRSHLKKLLKTSKDPEESEDFEENLHVAVWQIKNEKEHSCSLTDAKYTSKEPIQKMKREVENSSGKKIRRSAEDQIIVKKANERRFIELIFVIARPVVDKYNNDDKVGFRLGAKEQNLV